MRIRDSVPRPLTLDEVDDLLFEAQLRLDECTAARIAAECERDRMAITIADRDAEIADLVCRLRECYRKRIAP